MRGLKVHRSKCEALLIFLRERSLIVKGATFLRRGCTIVVPVARQLSEEEAESLISLGISFEDVESNFHLQEVRPATMLDYLEDKLPPHLLESVPKSFDIIGEIVILELPKELEKHGPFVGEAAMKVHRRARLVLNKTSDISGKFRVGEYEVIAGQGSTETLHKEHGCVYKLDPTRVFFTPRLSTERARVARQVRRGEVVADLFAGVGPFSILIARRVQGVKVYSVDVNPSAFKYLEENIKLNNVEDRVLAIFGDAEEVARSQLRERCNRVIMNLPAGAELFLEAASNTLLSEGGVVHLHTFIKECEELKTRLADLGRRFKGLGWNTVKTFHTRVIREIGARTYHMAIDIGLSERK